MDLKDYRKEIDSIDSQLIRLFSQRMETAAGIAQYKKDHGMPVLDQSREQQKLLAVAEAAPEAIRDYTLSLYSLLFDLSRSYQTRLLGYATPLTHQISDAIQATPALFPEHATVACQGVEGAYSQLACSKLFRLPHILYFSSFEAVFSAIEKGLCRYGVVPLENSTAGSVNAVYDLMMRHAGGAVRPEGYRGPVLPGLHEALRAGMSGVLRSGPGQ